MLVTNILTGFAAVVFVLFSGFAVFIFMTTPHEQVPGILRTKQAVAVYYWGLIVLLGALTFVTVWILHGVGVLFYNMAS